MRTLLLSTFLLSWAAQAFAQDNRWEQWHYYINTKGEQALRVSAKSINPFRDGLARVEKYVAEGGKAFWNYGYINKEGKLVIAPQYERASDFKEGVAFVKKRNETFFVLINPQGERLGNKTFEKEGYISEGMIAFRENGKIGFLNTQGQMVIAPKYVEEGGFSEGYCSVAIEKGNKWLYGFIDKTGKEVVPCIYDQNGTSSFSDGLARTRLPNRMIGFINAKNEVVIPGKYATAESHREGFYPVAFGPNQTQWGLVNAKNDVVIRGQYDDMKPVYGGLTRVQRRGKTGYLRSDGSVFIPIEYDDTVYEFHSEGLINARKGEKDFIILASGKIIEGFKAGAAIPEAKVFPFYNTDRKWGLMDFEGNVVVAPSFCFIGRFSEGLAPARLCQ